MTHLFQGLVTQTYRHVTSTVVLHSNIMASMEDIMNESSPSYAKYPVFIIHSRRTLDSLYKFMVSMIKEHKTPEDGNVRIGPMHVQRIQKNETARTICLMDWKGYEIFQRIGYGYQRIDDFSIAPYYTRVLHTPTANEIPNRLFVILPQQMNSDYWYTYLEEQLHTFEAFGIIPRTKPPCFEVMIPIESRVTGQHNGYGYIKFAEDTDVHAISTICLLLHDSFLQTTKPKPGNGSEGTIKEGLWLSCFWAKKNNNTGNRTTQPPTTGFTTVKGSGRSRHVPETEVREKPKKKLDKQTDKSADKSSGEKKPTFFSLPSEVDVDTDQSSSKQTFAKACQKGVTTSCGSSAGSTCSTSQPSSSQSGKQASCCGESSECTEELEIKA